MAKSGFGLKFVQWFIRGVQFLCCALILGIYSYFLATLHSHNFTITNQIRAVEGISGAGALYTLLGLLFLCCLAGHTLASFIAIVLDVCFVGAFVYVAVANKGGASSCTGYLDTPFGQGQSTDRVGTSTGFTSLPSFHTACKLQTATLAVSIIAIIFFIFSVLMELALARNRRRDKRYGPSPANDYTSGYGKRTTPGRGGFFSRIFSRRSNKPLASDEGNILPAHPHPDQVDGRTSYATEGNNQDHTNPYSTLDNGVDGEYNKYETGYGYTGAGAGLAVPHKNTGYGQPVNYRYEDGVFDRS